MANKMGKMINKFQNFGNIKKNCRNFEEFYNLLAKAQ